MHRVQRVPATEAQGRIHTSTATVAVLPEAEEVDIDINESELRIDIFHSGGAGGQNVNKVATAVRLTHLPTGHRRGLPGRAVAAEEPHEGDGGAARTASAIRSSSEQEREIAGARKQQVGTGERSEKIRTYNFPQDRLTDHRVGLTVHNLPRILDGELDDDHRCGGGGHGVATAGVERRRRGVRRDDGRDSTGLRSSSARCASSTVARSGWRASCSTSDLTLRMSSFWSRRREAPSGAL